MRRAPTLFALLACLVSLATLVAAFTRRVSTAPAAAEPPPPPTTGAWAHAKEWEAVRAAASERHGQRGGAHAQDWSLLADAVANATAARLGARLTAEPPPRPRAPHAFARGLAAGLAAAGAVVAALRRSAARRSARTRAAAARAALRAAPPSALPSLLSGAPGGVAPGAGALPAWAAFPDWERAEFLNTALRVAWPAASAAAAKEVPPLADAALADALPPWLASVTLSRFDLGPAPPTVEGVKVYPPPPSPPGAAAPGGGAGGAGGAGDRLVLELDLAWAAGGGQAVELALVPLPAALGRRRRRGGGGGGGSLRSALASAVAVTASVSRAALRARVRLEAGPLIRSLPIAAGLAVSLVDPPDVGFELHVLGGDVSLLPGLESWLGGLVRQGLRPFTLPGRFVHALVPGPPPLPPPPAGVLRLALVEASSLPRADFWSAADAYATAAVVSSGDAAAPAAAARRPPPTGGGAAATPARTRVVPNSPHPVWRTDAVLVVADPMAQSLALAVYDADAFTGDDLVGAATLPLSHLAASPATLHDTWLDLAPPTSPGLGAGVRDAWSAPTSGLTGRAAKAARLGAAAAGEGVGLLGRARKAFGRAGGGAYGAGRLRVQATYFPFAPQQEEAETGEGGGAAPPPPPSRHASSPPVASAPPALSATGRDFLGGGALVVRPRRAAGLPAPPFLSRLARCFSGPAWKVRVRAGPAACEETGPAPGGTDTEPAWGAADGGLTLFLPRSRLDALLAGTDAWAAAEATDGGARPLAQQAQPAGVAAAAAAAAADPLSAGCFVLEVVDAARSRRRGGRVAGVVRIPAADLVAPGSPGVVSGDLPLEGGADTGGSGGRRPARGGGGRGRLVLGRPPEGARVASAGSPGGPPFLSVEARWVWLDPAAAVRG